jgi:glycosyltransferase involved in cell wall biosynthesis
LKIGILLRELDVSGGTQRLALCLAKELRDAGEDVRVYGVQVDCSRCHPELSEKVSPIDLGKRLPAVARRPGIRRTLDRFLGTSPDFLQNRLIAEMLPDDLDVLNVHEHAVYGAGACWKARTGKPVVWSMNDVPGEFFRLWDPLHPWRKLDRVLNGKEWETRRWRRFAEAFDEIHVLSRMEGEKLRRETGLSYRVVIPGLDIDAFPFLPRKAPVGKVLRLFSNAILYPHRRLEDIVAALVLLKRKGVPFRWKHAGSADRAPEYAMRIRRMAEEAGVAGETVILGSVPEPELVRLYQEADVFLFPNTPQSWGLAPFEAMACGTPVVVSRGAGASEVLTHRRNAILVDPYAPSQIADAVEDLHREEGLWEALHREGRRFVEENIRWDLFARRVSEAFYRLAYGETPRGADR